MNFISESSQYLVTESWMMMGSKQGRRISFYLTSAGEEAINIASAAALTEQDIILPQYREPGVLLWRGFSLQEFADQCFGNKADYGEGRQMPIHYGSRKHNFFTISSPIALTYRVGHHSTSDDSTKYRQLDEIVYWKNARNPVNRFKNWVQNCGWWSEQQETQLRNSVRKQLLEVIQVAEKTEKPPLSEMLSDVFDYPPSNLQDQEKHLRETIRRHPNDYPSDNSV
ncbi:hypothetical protein GQ457_03G032200 [Hibiscus cannabinus]